MEGMWANIIKYLLFATNLLVFLMGLIVLAFGIYVLVDGKSMATLVESSNSSITINAFTTAAIIMIVIASFVILVAFFGCCGAIKENRCMLGTYFAIILALFIVFIAGAVVSYTQGLDEIKQPLKNSMNLYDKSSSDTQRKSVTAAWDDVQFSYKCCGVDRWQDWNQNQYLLSQNKRLPDSCCDWLGANNQTCKINPDAANVPGCFDKVKTAVEKNSDYILGVAIAIIIIMFLNMIFAFVMCTMAH